MRNSVDGVMGHYGRKSDGFDIVVEPMLVQQLIQTLIEQVTRGTGARPLPGETT